MLRQNSDLDRTWSQELEESNTSGDAKSTNKTDDAQLDDVSPKQLKNKRLAFAYKCFKKTKLRLKQLCMLIWSILDLKVASLFTMFRVLCSVRWFFAWLFNDEDRGNSIGKPLAAWITTKIDQVYQSRVPPAEPRHPPVVNLSSDNAYALIELYCRQNIPVVINFDAETDSAANNDSMLSTSPMTWSRDSFIDEFGDDLVPMTKPDGDTVKRPLRSLMDTEEQYYLKGSDSLFVAHPELKRGVEAFLKPFESAFRQNVMGIQMFMSQDTSKDGLGFHCANRRNLILQLEGEKTWTFVSPKDTHLMYPVFLRSHVAVYSNVGHAHRVSSRIHEVPLYKHAQKWTCRLKAGQGLINPAWWWHSIENHGGSFALATRWGHGLTGQNNLFELMQITSIPILKDSLLNAKLGGNDLVVDENELSPQEKRTAFSACAEQLYW